MSATSSDSSSQAAPWQWVAGEPFRLFFISGALWSIIAVLLWPAFYAGWLGYYPSVAHSALMIQAFGGAFVVGFLGTAGPRVTSAAPLGWREVGTLLFLHEAGAVAHLIQRPAIGDFCFAAMLALLLALLGWRVARSEEALPPALLLAATGLLCGIIGALLPWFLSGDPPWIHRFARLLQYQGFLLLPTLGIGSFLFPRMLGGDFGGDDLPRGRAFFLAGFTVFAILLSFAKEAMGLSWSGNLQRLGMAAVYLGTQVRWRRPAGSPPRGSLTTGLFWALGLGATALLLIPTNPGQQASIAHLLYIGGFGLLMLVVGSRVLFGHSGELEGFHRVSKGVRWLIFLVVLAAATRATPAWRPSTTISHHIYAAGTWTAVIVAWLVWHRQRFFRRDEE